MNSKEHIGSFYAILSGFLYGFLGYFGMSVIHSGMSPSTMLFWRFLISSVVMLIVIFPTLKRISDSKYDLLITFLGGAGFYSLSTLLYFIAAGYIGSGLAMVIFFTYPVILMVINYFLFRQTIPAPYYLAIIMILVGMTLLVDWHEMRMDLIGIAFGLVSAFFYAGYLALSKQIQASPNMSAFMLSSGCSVAFLLFSLFQGSFIIPTQYSVWANLIGVGIISTAVPILLLLYSLKLISSDKAAILSVLEPVFVVIFGFILLGETLYLKHVIGITIVLSGALLTLFSHKIKIPRIQAAQ
ncbi:DMT family transporter [Legionella impletisoli]|uniref:Membrane protein n=1 Tax=Legionella impletisoli TaxID=343510 RepID=A0A917JKX3_9GAMM|nr:DMT family transporter [Legionella impletisoli]GGI75494.1 membrane protein [Legionella impletisoli]